MVPEREQSLWVTLSMMFEDTSTEFVANKLLAGGFIPIDEIKRTYFDVVAPGMSLLRLTDRNRQDAFSHEEIYTACFQFYHPRPIRFLIKQFGKFICHWAGGVVPRWEVLEKELLKQSVLRMS